MEMEHRNQYDWGGAGDRCRQHEEDDDYYWDDELIAETPTCSTRKLLINGPPVPVFPREKNENGNDEETPASFTDCQHPSRQERHPPQTFLKGSKGSTTGKRSLKNSVDENLSCPICPSPCIEEALTNCGLHRKLGNSMTYIRSKSRATIRDRCEDLYESTCEWMNNRNRNFGLLSGMFLAWVFISLCNWTTKKIDFNFLHYIWLAAVNYSGATLKSLMTAAFNDNETIPKSWMARVKVALVGNDCEESYFETWLNRLYPF